MKDYLDKKTRINVKYHFAAFATAICLQRKKWFGWVTVSWTYPSTQLGSSCKSIKEYLFWRETYIEPDESQIGKEIMLKCSMDWDNDTKKESL